RCPTCPTAAGANRKTVITTGPSINGSPPFTPGATRSSTTPVRSRAGGLGVDLRLGEQAMRRTVVSLALALVAAATVEAAYRVVRRTAMIRRAREGGSV